MLKNSRHVRYELLTILNPLLFSYTIKYCGICNTFNNNPINKNKMDLRYICDLVSHATGPLQLPNFIFLIPKCCNSNTKTKQSSIMHELHTKSLPIVNYTLWRDTVQKVMMNSLCQPIMDNTMAHQYFLLCPPKHWMKITGITMEWFHVDWCMSTNANCEVQDAIMRKSYHIYEYHNRQKKRIAIKLVKKQQTKPYLCVWHPTV